MAPTTETCLATCWSCLGEFDALAAAWCSHDPKLPSKICPSCQRCFCSASEKYKQEFWRRAPAPLLEELEVLSRSKDRLGDILVKMGKLTTPQLLTALVIQSARSSETSLAQVLHEEGLVSEDDLETAIKTRGVSALTDTRGSQYSTDVVCDGNDPAAILQYLLSLAARRGASDLHVEPRPDGIAVRYRIEDVSFRLDPIPKRFEVELMQRLFHTFRLDPARVHRPQRGRTTERLLGEDYDLVAQSLPTAYGTSVSIKLIDRATFIKDFTTLGLVLEDRIRLVEVLRRRSGLVIVSAPLFEGGNTTAYSIMDFLVRAQREVVSLEDPVQWPVEGARQVEVREGVGGQGYFESLRAVVTVRPDVVVTFALPDRQSAILATQMAQSLLMVCVLPALSATQAVMTLLDLGVSRQQLAGVLSVVTCQRLVRRICPICRETTAAPPGPHLAQAGIGPEDAARMAFYRGRGCPSCNRVGYRGRQAAFEVLTGAPEIAAGLGSGLSGSELETLARGSGMKTLRERGVEMVAQGVTTFEELETLRL